MKTAFFTLLGCVGLTSCQVLVFSPGELRTLPESEWIASRSSISSRKVSDGKAYVSGYTSGTYVKDQETHTDTLAYIEVQFIHKESNDTIILSSDDYGKYTTPILPGTYDLYVSNPGFCKLSVKSIQILQGEMKQVDVILGQGRGTNAYTMGPDDQITAIPYRH